MSNSVWPHRRQPTRLCRPWDSPGKNSGVGCHFFLQCRKGKSESEVAQSCPTLRDPMDCSLPGSSIHGVVQARVLEWGAIAFSAVWKHCLPILSLPRSILTCIVRIYIFSVCILGLKYTLVFYLWSGCFLSCFKQVELERIAFQCQTILNYRFF